MSRRHLIGSVTSGHAVGVAATQWSKFGGRLHSPAVHVRESVEREDQGLLTARFCVANKAQCLPMASQLSSHCAARAGGSELSLAVSQLSDRKAA